MLATPLIPGRAYYVRQGQYHAVIRAANACLAIQQGLHTLRQHAKQEAVDAALRAMRAYQRRQHGH